MPRVMMHSYLRHMRARGLMPSSIEKRMSILRRAECAIGRDLHTATLEELRVWLDLSVARSARTRYDTVSHLACYFRWLMIEGFIEADPTLRLERPKLRRGLPRPVANEDVREALVQAPTAEIRAMVALAAFAGLRCAEISGLQRSDVLDRQSPALLLVVMAKGGRERLVPAHPEVLEALAPVLPVKGRIFPGRVPSTVSRLVRTHLHACGIEASAHQLRHWFATAVYASSSDLRLTQELLGHASPTTTAIYTALAQGRAAVVVDSLSAA